MPALTNFDIVLFAAQILVLYIVVSISLYNLTQSNNNKELWISLLSSFRRLFSSNMFLTLPSNSSMDVYPENKLSDYVVHLPKEINLTRSWELGLSEIMYPNSWYNIDTNQCYIFYQRGALEFVAVLPAGYYQHPQYVVRQILHEMKREFQARNKVLVSKEVLTKPIDFLFNLTYNSQTLLTTMSIQHKDGAPMVEREGNMQPDVVVTLSDELASVLGFRKTWYREIEEHTLESVANVDTVNAVYVYCDVIEHRTVGHTLAPLIGVLPVTGKPGSYVSKRYDKIQYHPVLKKNFSDIHTSLRDDQTKRIRFRRGKVIVTLHLRPKKLNSL